MICQNKPAAFATVADRLGKLIPRLASDHDGEVTATAAAIGRTLASVGLDWHDLTERLTGQTVADLVAAADSWAASPAPSRPYQEPERAQPTWSAEKEAEFQASRKPKKEPPPWPTWGMLSHFGKLAWMDAILRDGDLSPTELEAFRAIHAPYYRAQEWTRKGANTFNRHVRTMWERGWRPEKEAA